MGAFPRIDIDWAKVDEEVREVLSERQAELFGSAESPGIAGGDARFGTAMNHAIIVAGRAASLGEEMERK